MFRVIKLSKKTGKCTSLMTAALALSKEPLTCLSLSLCELTPLQTSALLLQLPSLLPSLSRDDDQGNSGPSPDLIAQTCCDACIFLTPGTHLPSPAPVPSLGQFYIIIKFGLRVLVE